MKQRHFNKFIVLNLAGFTLVELMIVVSIIGILAAVAIPNYAKFQNRARQTEAKIGLSDLLVAEKSSATDSGSYSACLFDIGLNGATSRFYSLGFLSPATSTCGPTGGLTCAATYSSTGAATPCTVSQGVGSGTSCYTATAKQNSATITDCTKLAGSSLISTSFTAQAMGAISGTNAGNDVWIIGDTAALSNTTNGL